MGKHDDEPRRGATSCSDTELREKKRRVGGGAGGEGKKERLVASVDSRHFFLFFPTFVIKLVVGFDD